jgi:hypothetical protein
MDDAPEPWLPTRRAYGRTEVTSLIVHRPAEPRPHALVGKTPRFAAPDWREALHDTILDAKKLLHAGVVVLVHTTFEL